MAHDVFICYSFTDKTIADLVVTGLEKRGVSCWVAPRDLKPGMSLGSAIFDAIKNSQIVILIFSGEADHSQQVIREIDGAINNGLDVIPFRVENVQPSGKLKYFLSMSHWIDGFPLPIEEHIGKLVETLRVYLGIEPEGVQEEGLPGEDDEKPQVFIAYSRQDNIFVDKLVVDLRARGVNTWHVAEEIKGTPIGKQNPLGWRNFIQEALETSAAMVIVVSPSSIDSPEVQAEWNHFASSKRPIYPILVKECKLPFYLQIYQIWDLTKKYDEKINDLANALLINKDLQTEGEEENKLRKRVFDRVARGYQDSSPAYIGSMKLKMINTLQVQNNDSKGEIQFCVGDVTQGSSDQAVDVLVISAFRDQYYPVPGSVLGALYGKGIHVEDFAENKEVDLRGAFSCWLSKEIFNPPEGIHFKRILCFEPEESAKAGEQIGDIFRSIAPFVGGSDPIRSVGTTLVAAGSSKRITETESLKLLVEAAVHWMSSGLPIEKFKIICLPNQNVKQLTGLFDELKSQYASLSKHKQSQFAYDCFISYSHQDMREVELFVDLLHEQKQDMKIFIDKHNLDPGSAWQREIYEAIDDCRKVATFFSPTYLNSKVCLEEFNIALCRHRESEQPVLKPIYLYSANLPTYMRLIQFIDCRESNREKLEQAAMIFLESLH